MTFLDSAANWFLIDQIQVKALKIKASPIYSETSRIRRAVADLFGQLDVAFTCVERQELRVRLEGQSAAVYDFICIAFLSLLAEFRAMRADEGSLTVSNMPAGEAHNAKQSCARYTASSAAIISMARLTVAERPMQ